MITDLEGNPTPALFAFRKTIGGELRVAFAHSDGDDQFIPATVIRYICATLSLDLALFDTIH